MELGDGEGFAASLSLVVRLTVAQQRDSAPESQAHWTRNPFRGWSFGMQRQSLWHDCAGTRQFLTNSSRAGGICHTHDTAGGQDKLVAGSWRLGRR